MAGKERNSSVELLKLFAIVFIVLLHAMPTPSAYSTDFTAQYIDPNQCVSDIQRLIMLLLRYPGQVGNLIFLTSSAWFLLDSDRVDPKKVVRLMADTFTVSVLFLGAFLLAGYRFSFGETAMQFFPIWVHANWYVTCYLLLYLIHPMLNAAARSLSRRGLLVTVLMAAIIYSGFQVLRPASFYYSNLVGFACVYLMTAYMKLHMPRARASLKFNVTALLIGIAGLAAMVLGTNFLGLKISWFSNKLTRWNVFMNPFMIVIALSSLNLAMRRSFVNRKINYLAGLSLLIYIIHANRLVHDHLKGDIFKYIYLHFGYGHILGWYFLFALTLLAGGVVLAILYRYTAQKVLYKLIDLVYPKAKRLCAKVVDKLERVG